MKITPRLIAAIAVATGLALTGCAGGSSEEADGPIELRMATWGNDSRVKLTQEALDAFTAANPDITVTLENSEWSSYWDKLATTTAGNNSPDLIQMDEGYIAAYGTRGALLDLSTVSDALDLSAMSDADRETGLVDGTLVGAPVGITNYAIGVNTGVLEAAGIPLPDDTTWTWDDFAEISRQVSEALGSEGVYGVEGFGTFPHELATIARQNGQSLWPLEGETPISADMATSYFDYAQKLIDTKAAPPASVQVENSSVALDAMLFATNKAAFRFMWSTQVSAFGNSSGNVIKLLRLPATTPGEHTMVSKASMYWSISARTEHPEATAKLVDFLLTDPVATEILGTERGIPAIAEVQDRVAPQLDDQARISLDFTQAIAPELVSPPQVTPVNASGFNTEFASAGTEVLFGNLSPADGAAKVLSLIDTMGK